MTEVDRALLDVGRLRVLREVGLRGSIAAAARSLGITASAVSQQLAVLEREAGLSLVDRTPRGAVLTGAGRALAERAGELLDLLTATRADIDRLAGAVAGSVRIAAVASAAVGMVSAAVRLLASQHPGIDVTVRVAEPAESLTLLQHGDVEIAIVDEYDHLPLALPGPGAVRELGAEPLCLVSADATTEVALAALADRPWVLPPDDAACGRAVRLACRAAGFEPRVRWTTDDLLVLARAVAGGHGIAVLPRSAVAREVGGIEVTPLAQPRLQRRLRAVTRPASAGRPAVATVLDAVAQSADGSSR